MVNAVKYLEQLELSEIEAKLYLKLLEAGPTSVKELANAIGINRAYAYLQVDLLVEKGLAIKVVRGTKKKIAPNAPDSLKALIDKKTETLEMIKKSYPDVLKTLNASFGQQKSSNEAEIKYYVGKNGVKKIYEEALRAKELRSYVNIAIMYDNVPENSLLFAGALKTNTELTILELIENSARSREQTAFQTENTNHERYFYKFLPKEVKLSAADTLIYDGKVSIINVKDK